MLQQLVVVDGSKSDMKPVTAGVPQCSRQRPSLFIIYINNITTNIESDILIFADDTSLLSNGNSLEITSKILNKDLAKIEDWSSVWKVNLMHTNPNNFSTLIKLNNETVKQVSTHKHVSLKANRKLAILRRVKLLIRHTLYMLYKF